MLPVNFIYCFLFQESSCGQLRQSDSSSGSLQFEAVTSVLTPEKTLRLPKNVPHSHFLEARVGNLPNVMVKFSQLQNYADSNSTLDDPLAEMTDVCWNPLDGPVMYKKSPEINGSDMPKNLPKEIHRVEESDPNAASEIISPKRHSSVENITKIVEPVNSVQDKDKSQLVAAKMPWFDGLNSSDGNFLPLLGIFPLTDLGFWSDADVAQTMRKKVQKNFPHTSFK